MVGERERLTDRERQRHKREKEREKRKKGRERNCKINKDYVCLAKFNFSSWWIKEGLMDKYLEIGGKISQFWFFPLSTGCLNNYPRILFSDEIVLKIVLCFMITIYFLFSFLRILEQLHWGLPWKHIYCTSIPITPVMSYGLPVSFSHCFKFNHHSNR